jgi:hypothetical protein
MYPTLVIRKDIVETRGNKMAKYANCGAFVSPALIGFSASGSSLPQFCATRMPTATPPKWLCDKYPDILPVDIHTGHVRGFGSAQ